jgi:hypothetical protein
VASRVSQHIEGLHAGVESLKGLLLV